MKPSKCCIDEFKKVLCDESCKKMVIDIRGASELRKMPMVECGVHIPLEQLPDEIDSLPDDIPIYILCARGMRAARAAVLLSMAGKQPVIVEGGMIAYYNSLM